METVPATLVRMGLTSSFRRGARPRQLARGGVRRPAASSSYGVVLSILFAAGLIYTLLGAVLLPAARSLSHDLHASQIDTTWVLTAYILSGGVATPIAGRLGDMYGKQRTLVWVLVVVAAGTLL
ncbi:MAG TPA: MFS transporter, partial [Solirubrobacteraceae bacterium]